MSYVLTRDVVIPAGTEIGPAPGRIHFIAEHGEAVTAFGQDDYASLTFNLEEALKSGAIRRAT